MSDKLKKLKLVPESVFKNLFKPTEKDSVESDIEKLLYKDSGTENDLKLLMLNNLTKRFNTLDNMDKNTPVVVTTKEGKTELEDTLLGLEDNAAEIHETIRKKPPIGQTSLSPKTTNKTNRVRKSVPKDVISFPINLSKYWKPLDVNKRIVKRVKRLNL